MKKSLTYIVGLLMAIITPTVHAQTTLIGAGSNWKYSDSGIDLGTTWRTILFDDVLWNSGNAELGYGDGDETTTVSYGPDSDNKYITTYFRKTFSVADPTAFTALNFELLCDDGAVVYLNGHEIFRDNMPSGSINYNTEASSTVAWPTEDDWNDGACSPLLLEPGNNVLAVEVHQDEPSSSDISFDFKITGADDPIPVELERVPYLQKATQTSIYICWRTNIPIDSRVIYGTSPEALDYEVTSTDFVTDHFVHLTDLDTHTTYYYRIGNNSVLYEVTAQQKFRTHPAEGQSGAYRFWVIGDSGMGNGNQNAVTNSFIEYNDNEHVDGWIMLGDNAYESGFDSEYQDGFFDAYPEILPNVVVWPSPGNHDYNNHIPFSPPPAYYEIFNLPTAGEAGGVPSGTEKYYSWNFGNVHFISIDSYDEGRSTSDPMALWLEDDLAANTLPWVIAYWHHPPYTKGSHDSDDWLLDGELIDMRENILPILEEYGVDLVLNGHSHCYERSNLIDGHYGYSETFNPDVHLLDGGSGDYIHDCPYMKTSIDPSHQGTIAAVVGCSGKLSGTDSEWPHPIFEKYSNDLLGSMIIEVMDNRMTCEFITAAGTVFDQFTILKDAGVHTEVEVCAGKTADLSTSWNGPGYWFPGDVYTDTLSINPVIGSVFYVEDSLGCITDTIEVIIKDWEDCQVAGTPQENTDFPYLISNAIPKNNPLKVYLPEATKQHSFAIKIVSINGQLIAEKNYANYPQDILEIPGINQAGNYICYLLSAQGNFGYKFNKY